MSEYMLKKLPIDNNFNSVNILELTNLANEALNNLDKSITKIHNYELILQPLTIREAVASNEIENIRTTTLEMLQAELLSPITLPTVQKEVIHYKQSLLKGFEKVIQKGSINLEDLVEIHCGIVPDRVGIRNRSGVYVGNRLGEVVYTPPQLEKEILEFLQNLFEYMNSKQKNSLIKIIISHYQFEAIHPFFDGNGRMGRILMALQFCMENKLKYPILYTSGYILKNKATYYQLFKEIQNNNNWEDWIVFHLNGIINQASETMDRVEEIDKLNKKFIKELNQQIKLQKLKKQNIEDYFFKKAFYTQTNMSKELGLSRNTTKKYLETLHISKVLDQRQAGREILYFIPEFLDILS